MDNIPSVGDGLGLSIADMLSSFCIALSSIMVPKEMNYFIPYSQGNAVSRMHKISLSVLVILVQWLTIAASDITTFKYNKKDNDTNKRFEPWFHRVALMYPLFSV